MGGQQDRQGLARQGQCVSWRKREDERWTEEVRHRQEQERQACEQEAKRGRQESIQEHSRLDRCCAEGQEGSRLERLRGNQEGLCVVQEGQGALHEVRPSHHSWVRVASRTALVVTHAVACFSALQKSI